MKLARISVHNVMGVKDVEADLTGHHVWLVGGRNGSGKSSVLQSVVIAICGLEIAYPTAELQAEIDTK